MLKTVSSITNAIGALNYKGTWNASTNTPTLASGVGTKGDYYVVSVAGSTTLDGISNWGVGDLATFNGSAWQRVEGGADGNFVNLSVSSTSTLSGLTASTALALNASKEIVSVTNTGTGSNVLATSPTLSGNVGIGTSSPSTLLHLKGNGNTNAVLLESTTVQPGGFQIIDTDDSESMRVYLSSNSGNGRMAFAIGTGVDPTTVAERMAILTSSGAVLIGNTAAVSGAKLEVTGAISATTTIATGGYTVATLPAGTVGQRAYVTDALSPVYNGALTGGGAVTVPVFRNATIWVSA